MSAIAIITTSPFSGLEQINELTIPSLLSQTCKDFTWYYFDGYHKSNKSFFSELQEKVPFKIVHLPLLHAVHYPHDFKWEPYNSALIVIEEEFVLRLGRFRLFHPKSVEFSIQYLNKNQVLDFDQIVINEFTNYEYSFLGEPRFGEETSYFKSHCGMFAFKKENLIYQMNGNDEVGLHWFHFEDSEMCRRGFYLTMPTTTVFNALVRYNHCKDWTKQSLLDEPVKQPYDSPLSIYNLRYYNNRSPDIWSSESINILNKSPFVTFIDYEGMKFGYSEIDNSIVPCGGDVYAQWVLDRRKPKSIIGINGLLIGRNVATLYEETKKLASVESRTQFVRDNYLEKRFYV